MEEKLRLLNEQLRHARRGSPFYAYLPAEPLQSLEELREIPLMSEADVAGRGTELLCCPPGDVRRCVTLSTSGTTAAAKRLAFTEADLSRTVEFFRWGMHTLCLAGDAVAVFLPGRNPDGVCDLLSRGLRGFGAVPAVYGPVVDYGDAADFVRDVRPKVLVGFPAQMRRLALLHPELRPARVLLSADYCAPSAVRTMERVWGCEAYVHYGLTESGFGCAVETPERRGMLLREDVLLETLPDGELVLTTLCREAMPLIRYRTGDLGELGSGGTLLRVLGRKREAEKGVSVMALDGILFDCDAVLDYTASLSPSTLTVRVLGPTAGLEERLAPLTGGRTLALKEVGDLPFRGKRFVEMGEDG